MSLIGATNAEKIWNYCKSKRMNDYGCAGVLANLDCESGLNPMNLEDSYERSHGYTDASYTRAVDTGSYTNFATDCAGFGLAQWTWVTRKQGLLTLAQERGVSVSDMEMQLDYLYKELSESYTSVLTTLRTASSVLEASNAMLLKFECPLDAGVSVQNLRASYAQRYYNRFAAATSTNTEVKKDMGYITTAKKSSQKLSEHFSSNEFDCHGGGCCNSTVINEKLVQYLEQIRKHFNKPITITSGYRCVVHNRNVGGATGSRHGKGDAADIVVQGVAPRAVAQYAESIGILGIGLYETASDGHFVHIDTRDYKSFWYGQACAARTTFGANTGAAANGAVNNTGNAPENYMLSMGSSGTRVRELQENLITLGYDCGRCGADGIFGNGTVIAVKKFQHDNGLGADGIAGRLTRAAIEKALKKTDASDNSGYTVKATASVLNIRRGAGTNYPVTGSIRDRGIYTIVSEASGAGASKWGKLSDGRGWISLDYCMKY